jgi:MYXO-CTERM domain-containing protein
MFAVGVVVLATSAPARADDVGGGPGCPASAIACERSDVDFLYRDAVFDGIEWDTGWVPNNSGVQIRLGLRVLGETEVAMGGEAVTSWPAPLTVAIPGRPQAGRLVIGYGIEVIARIRIDVVVLGTHYTWEGDIPDLLDVPADLLMAATSPFDPFILPGDDPDLVTASDSTARVVVYRYDITGGLISIPGIVGEVRVEAQGSLTSTYQTNRIDVSDGPSIEASGATSSQGPGPNGFGAAADYSVQPHGTLTHDGTITLYPHVEVSILGVSIIDQDLLSLPIPIVDSAAPIAFDPASVHAPLPDVSVTPASIAINGSQGVLVQLHNGGERTLQVELVSHPAELAIDPAALVIPAGGDASRGVRLDPSRLGDTIDVTGTVIFATDDPDTPRIEIPVTIANTGANPDPDPLPNPDPNPMDGDGEPASGCGCDGGSSGSGSAAIVLAAMILAALRRRRNSGLPPG